VSVSSCDHSAAEHAATRRLINATYLLVLATVALVFATAMLTVATFKEKSRSGHEPATTVVTRETARTERKRDDDDDTAADRGAWRQMQQLIRAKGPCQEIAPGAAL
jgi:hypothetical protein